LNSLTADSEKQISANITNNAANAEEIHFYKGTDPNPTTETNNPFVLNDDPTGTGAQLDVTVSGQHNISEYIAGYSPVDGIIPNFDKLTIASDGVLTASPLVKLEFKAKEVVAVLEELFAIRGRPKFIRSDNGPEFASKAVKK
ncbi:hypothetical protein LCGC14_1884980, partial [marine sediment metagenome]